MKQAAAEAIEEGGYNEISTAFDGKREVILSFCSDILKMVLGVCLYINCISWDYIPTSPGGDY